MSNQRLLHQTFLWLLVLWGLIFIPGFQAVTIITNCIGLQAMNNNLTGNYQLGNDINCSATASWNMGAGFNPVGNRNTSFSGTFDGQYFTIFNLVINRSSTSDVGLFGYAGSTALIQSVGLVGGSVSGTGSVGSLVGTNAGLVSNSYATGSVSSFSCIGSTVGGLVGSNGGGLVSNSYATGSVSSSCIGSYIGGLAGLNGGFVSNSYARGSVFGSTYIYAAGLVGWNFGTVSDSYATGSVSARIDAPVGGLAADNNKVVSNSYWDIQTSSKSGSAGGTGLPTALMQQPGTFTGWDFSVTWTINPGRTYPLLQLLVFRPMLTMPLSNSALFVGDPLLFSIPANSFIDLNGLQLSYSTFLANQQPLPTWLFFQALTQTFVGTPLSGAQGVLDIVVMVCNIPSKCSQGTFGLLIQDRAPIVQTTIPTQQALNGQYFQLIIPAGVFIDPDADRLELTASMVNGQAWPTWLSFNGPFGIFSGTSTLRGVYSLNVTANDNFGGQVSTQFDIVTPNTAPKVVISFPNQALVVNVPFSFTLPTTSFIDIDGDAMVYGATLFGGAPLLPWLNFDSSALSFTGTPNSEGFLMVAVTAIDTYNASASLYFGITVSTTPGNAPPALVIRLQDQTTIAGKNYQWFLPVNMFIDPNGYTLIYSSTLGDSSVLPDWLTFNSSTLMFSGIPPSLEVLKIDVRVDNGHGGSASDSFNLIIQANQPPVLINELPNQQVAVGANFRYTVPVDTFYDASGDSLIYSANQLGGTSLPNWLIFDTSTRVFSGTPKPTDTNTYAAKTSTIQVCASDGQVKSCTSFVLSVTGQSPLAQAITAIVTIGSILSAAYGVYRNRAWLWNTFAQKKYRKPTRTINVGDQFSYQFAVSSKKVFMVRVYTSHGYSLPQEEKLPDWMILDRTKLTLTGKPPVKESFWICAIGHDGRNLEAFMLHVVEPSSEGGTMMSPLLDDTEKN